MPGLIGLTISLAAQETASNIFSGIVILIDKPFAVGDWILVGDVEGEVIDINFRSIKIRSLDKTVSVITNSKVCSSTIVNCAMRSTRPYKFTLGVTYNTSRAKLEQLMADLTAMLEASPSVEKGSALVRSPALAIPASISSSPPTCSPIRPERSSRCRTT